jgi:nicotinate-nucleotide adenylyltransferase
VTVILGGAFDPPHDGHVALAAAAKRHLGVDRLLVLVATAPGHKEVVAAAESRLELARAAFPDEEVELDRHPRTVDLLRERRFDDPLLLIGADELCAFPDWKEPGAVLDLARLAVATRPGYSQARLDEALARLARPDRVEFFELSPHEVASSSIRALAARGETVDAFVPAPVAALIRDRALYRSTAGLH